MLLSCTSALISISVTPSMALYQMAHFTCTFGLEDLPANFYTVVKAALRHKRADSEEDREGLGCHLGQGLSLIELRETPHKQLCTW